MKKFLTFIFAFCIFTIAANAETVVYNTNTGKYHKQNCPSASKCTVNCIKIDKQQAIKKGGTPCKKCGG